MLGPHQGELEDRARDQYAARQRHGSNRRRTAAGALRGRDLGLGLRDLCKRQPRPQCQFFRFPGRAYAETRDFKQRGAERALQLPRRAVHRGPGTPGTTRGARKSTFLHHDDECIELRGSNPAQEV